MLFIYGWNGGGSCTCTWFTPPCPNSPRTLSPPANAVDIEEIRSIATIINAKILFFIFCTSIRFFLSGDYASTHLFECQGYFHKFILMQIKLRKLSLRFFHKPNPYWKSCWAFLDFCSFLMLGCTRVSPSDYCNPRFSWSPLLNLSLFNGHILVFA